MSATSTAAAVPENDVELVRRLGAGDARAAQALYERYVGGLLRFAVAIGGCRQSAEDAVHDTFIELLRHPARFDAQRGSLSAYLYAIARHRMARLARSARRLTDLEAEAADGDSLAAANDDAEPSTLLATRTATAEDEAERAQAIAQVRAAILSLPLLHREVIALCDLEELPYVDVALVLNCPVGTVRSRLHRARAQLARELAASGFGDPDAHDTPRNDVSAQELAPALLTCRGTVT